LLLRSAEIKPLLSDLLFFLILFGTVVLKDLDSFFFMILNLVSFEKSLLSFLFM